jgi:hypothetical protein
LFRHSRGENLYQQHLINTWLNALVQRWAYSFNGRTKESMLENDTPAEQQPAPISFSAEQQAKVDLIVKAAMGRAASETRRELETEKKRAEDLEGQLRETQAKAESSAAERDELKRKHADAEQHIITLRKKAFITDACIDHNFVDAPTVNSLVEQQLNWSDEKESFEVLDSDMTPAEFFTDFAQKKPYLVKSDVRTGSGSGDSSRSGLPTGRQQYKLEEIFGPHSSSKLANDLARRDPQEYRRLKSEARNKKLI